MDLTSPIRALTSLPRRGAPEKDLNAAEKLREALPIVAGGNVSQEYIEEIKQSICQLLGSTCWESRAAGYVASGEILAQAENASFDEVFLFEKLCGFIQSDLNHVEPRVRTSVVSVLKQLGKINGARTWDRFGEIVIKNIEDNLVIDSEERAKTMQEIYAVELKMKLDTDKKPVVAHETVGWKALETSLRGLQSLIGGYGAGFVLDGHLKAAVVDLVTLKCLKHENRYVREVGFDLCSAMVQVLADALGSLDAALETEDDKNETAAMLDRLACAVGLGLSDNWSQVRFAASVAVRTLLVGLSEKRRGPYMTDLVPRMCLNRYYLAQGVKLYSQETWKIVFGSQGTEIVAQNIEAVVQFYCSMTRADNHAVREAACYCIAELATKVDRTAVSNHVGALLNALIDAFKDESWPVRDAACVATADFVSGFPEESREQVKGELYKLWFGHLSDNIWSVREDSAVALGTVMRAYKDEAIEEVKSQLPEMFESVFKQDLTGAAPVHGHGHSHGREKADSTADITDKSAEASKYANRPSQPLGIVSGDLKTLKSDQDKYSNQQQFSCGSLAPKLRRGVGCMDHGFTRPKKLWEVTDGGIYLLRELAAVKPSEAESFLPKLAEVAAFASKNSSKVEDFYTLQETLWKQLVPIAKSLGKRPFKRYLEPFLSPMIEALECERKNQLCAHAAAYCIEELEIFLGQAIFRGRVEQAFDGNRLLDIVDRNRHLIHAKIAMAHPDNPPFR